MSRTSPARRSPLTRRRLAGLIAGAASIVVLAACGGSSTTAGGAGSTATTDVSFQLDWVKDSEFAGLFAADHDGLYKAAGLKVKFLDGSDVPSTAAVIAGGAAQLGIVSNMSRLADALKSDDQLVVVGALFQTSPAGLMTLPDRTITKADDLKGLRIGSDESGTADIETLFKVSGLQPDFTPVRVGYDAAPLFKKKIDAFYVYVNSGPTPYRLKGQQVNTVTFDDLGFKSYAGLIVTTRPYLTAHRQAVADFMAATAKGWQSAFADPDAAVQNVLDNYGMDLGLDEKSEVTSLKAQIPLMQSNFTKTNGLFAIDKTAVEGPMSAALVAAGKTAPPFATTFDTTVVAAGK